MPKNIELIVSGNDIIVEYLDKQILLIPEIKIYSNDRIGIVGENGVGKSTLMKVLLEKTKRI